MQCQGWWEAQVSSKNYTVEPPIKDPPRKDNLPTKDTLLDPFAIAVVHC